MSRSRLIGTAAALVAAAGVALSAGSLLPPNGDPILSAANAADAPAPLYYQDPDGKPLYSPTPKKTDDGRDYVAVPAPSDASDQPATMTAAEHGGQHKSDRKIKYYRNPMGLPDTSPVPKKDSMGMDYIAVYESDDSDDGSVKLSPGKIQRSGVKSEPAERRRLRMLVRAPGTIQLDERRISVIAMRAESFVQKVADVTTGSRVTRGQPLMEIYSPAVSSAAAEYLATITSKTTAGIEPYGRGSRQRLVNLDVPEPVIAEMEKSHSVPITIQWSSPRDGIVLQRNAIDGMRAQPGDILFRIADISLVWATVDVAERDLGGIAVGQPVTVRARSYPGRDFRGRISVIYPQLNKETRTARLRIELANADLALLPDMYVDAEIDTGNPAPVLVVAESAVLDTGSRQAVLVDKGQGRFEPREVKLGRRGDGYVEIRDGLAEGDAIVTSANFLIDAESNLKAALKGLAEGGNAQPTSAQGTDAHSGHAMGGKP
ncbi:efflux RND transporter periplasmic adaptor subunit [Bradyrhizobium iriomotense]|uniref:efflux RND transporter periplasmic adaptor subunit n=1 Tax=Bradyrhizobium iriomotense TaxID=441950 RepID=UPI001B8A340D|nr:efflux RND transporter periplasmic adaptor subunit [Bradyrhizobium iriomotense]MBR0783787.1 efflux RND transporter periplasmic adaptor subunit [Bradyrhizobium iriomotense]